MTSGTPSVPRPLDPFSIENLSRAFRALQQHASAKNDEVPYARYQSEEEKNIPELSCRLARGEYDPQPLRAAATTSGQHDPLSVEALEDRIVQRSVAMSLMASYRGPFLACSGGLHATKSQDSLRYMAGVLRSHPVTWILPLRVESCGDDTVRQVLIHDLKERFADKHVLDLITRWFDVGVLEVGRLLKNEVQVVTGQPVLTLLGDIYFHLALDIWLEKTAKTRLKGRSQVIRFVGEAILCFEEKRDADEVVNLLGKRLSEFGLVLDKEKTQLIECRSDAVELFCFLGSWFPSARHEGVGSALQEEASSSPEPSILGQREATQAQPSKQQPTAAPAGAAPSDPVELLVPTAEDPNASTAAGVAPEAAPADNDASQDTEPNAIPPGWAIRITTGREAMQRRDLRLYSAIATCAGLTLMEMRGVGDPILVDKSLVSAICDDYMASDERYQQEVAAHRAGEPVDIDVEFRRALDRARKEFTRAMGDLVEIYVADVVADEKTGKVAHRVYRLPDVRRRQIEHNAKSVYARPGGGRMLVDDWGMDVGR